MGVNDVISYVIMLQANECEIPKLVLFIDAVKLVHKGSKVFSRKKKNCKGPGTITL